MSLKTRSNLLLLALFAGLSTAAFGETSVAASLYGAFTGKTSANGVSQSPSNSAGGLVELRHIAKPYMGYEVTYSFNQANQKLSGCPVIAPGCTVPTVATLKANAHEVSADYIVSIKLVSIRPFALTGVGLDFDSPSGDQPGVLAGTTKSSTRPVFVYGAGFDFALVPHIGIRAQYRGNLYKAPNLTRLFTASNTFTQTAEPMVGVYLRF